MCHERCPAASSTSTIPSWPSLTKGANPYRQARERGVKLIGATSHYVTAGPGRGGRSFEQDTVRITHPNRRKTTSARCATWRARCWRARSTPTIHHRVFLNAIPTVVFPASPGSLRPPERMGVRLPPEICRDLRLFVTPSGPPRSRRSLPRDPTGTVGRANSRSADETSPAPPGTHASRRRIRRRGEIARRPGGAREDVALGFLAGAQPALVSHRDACPPSRRTRHVPHRPWPQPQGITTAWRAAACIRVSPGAVEKTFAPRRTGESGARVRPRLTGRLIDLLPRRARTPGPKRSVVQPGRIAALRGVDQPQRLHEALRPAREHVATGEVGRHDRQKPPRYPPGEAEPAGPRAGDYDPAPRGAASFPEGAPPIRAEQDVRPACGRHGPTAPGSSGASSASARSMAIIGVAPEPAETKATARSAPSRRASVKLPWRTARARARAPARRARAATASRARADAPSR